MRRSPVANNRANIKKKRMYIASKSRKDNKIIDIKEITEIFGCITAIISAFSLIIVFLQKYISFGRCFYFDFDINYYDFSFSAKSMFTFIITFIAGIIGVIWGVLQNTSWNLLEKINIINKTKMIIIKLITSFLIIIVTVITTFYFSILLIPQKDYEALFVLLVFISDLIMIQILRSLKIKSKKATIITVLIVGIALIVLFSCCAMKMDYDKAENQRVFPIILENKSSYVVISQSKEKYSAYECIIKGDTLNLFTDSHKFFNIDSTKTTPVEFEKVERVNHKPIPSSKFEEAIMQQHN